MTEVDPVVRHHTGSVEHLHALPMPTDGDVVELWVMHPSGPAVAMGSAQRPDYFDAGRLRADGVELAGRRSGGGAVFIDPAMTVWIDVVAPRSSPWYSSELTENFVLVGRWWQRALRSLGVETELCERSSDRTPASALACWAGLGWGELVVDGAKVVGLSQRRTRWGSRVQAMAVIDASAARAAEYLSASNRSVVQGAIPTVDLRHRYGIGRDDLEAAVIAAALAVQARRPRIADS